MYMVEWKYYIWKSMLWLLIPLFIICKFTSMQFETVYVDTHLIGKEEYQTFFQEYEGMLSLEKKTQIGKTDEVLRRYFSYANANPAKHYLVNETGWDAWIGNEKLDIILLAFIVFFSVYLVTNDYETGVYAVKYTSYYRKEKIYLSQQTLFLLYSVLMLVLSFFCEWLFYALRYGLSGYDFPIQSLWTFENSPLRISIWQCCIFIHLVKGIGIVFMGELSFLFGKYIRKLWLSFFVGMAILVIPYMIFNREQVRYYMQPLGLILGNGYFRGGSKTIMYDGVQIAERVGKISWRYFLPILGVTALCCAIIFIILFWNRNEKKCVWLQKSRFGFLFAFVETFLIASFCCMLVLYHQNPNRKMKTTYYPGKAYSDKEKIYVPDEEDRLVEYNYLSDEKNFIIRDVFAEKDCDGYYVDENYIYYYVKNEIGEVRVYKTSKIDFTSKLIYKEVSGDKKYVSSTKYLGLINVQNYDNVSMEECFEEDVRDFWVDGNYIFMIRGNGIEMIDCVRNDKISLVEKEYSGGEVAYQAGILYYIDSENQVVKLDVISRKADYVDIPKCRALAINGERLCFIAEDEKIGVYYDGESRMIADIESSPTSYIVCYDKYVFCASKENTLLCIDSENLNSYEVKCYDKSGNRVESLIYNVRVYNEEKLSLFVGENEDYNWVLCDYSII